MGGFFVTSLGFLKSPFHYCKMAWLGKIAILIFWKF